MSEQRPSETRVECEPVKPSLSRIGLVAYCALPPNHCFVRVPNEPGRWVMVHRCVVDCECSYCSATFGEPCRRGKHYGVGTHTARRIAHSMVRWRQRNEGGPTQHKPRISLTDIQEADRVIA